MVPFDQSAFITYYEPLSDAYMTSHTYNTAQYTLSCTHSIKRDFITHLQTQQQSPTASSARVCDTFTRQTERIRRTPPLFSDPGPKTPANRSVPDKRNDGNKLNYTEKKDTGAQEPIHIHTQGKG